MKFKNIEAALARGSAHLENHFGLTYYRFSDDIQISSEHYGINRGSIKIGDRLIFGYPSVGRLLSLRIGIHEQFNAPFFVEEKIDGYNVRLFLFEGEVMALTRGGFICPFSGDRARELLDISIFQEHPDLVLCAEMAGTNSPYNEEVPGWVNDDIAIYIFDAMRLDQKKFLSYQEKKELVAKFGLPTVRSFGCFGSEELDRLQVLMQQLNEEGREGVVLKEKSRRDYRAKYVTASSCLADIAVTAPFYYDLPPEYFTNRILQLRLYLQDTGVPITPELEKRLGSAFLGGLTEAMQHFQQNHRVERTFRCYFNHKLNAERMAECLKKRSPHGAIQIRGISPESGRWMLEFDRIYLKTTGLLGFLLGGGVMFD